MSLHITQKQGEKSGTIIMLHGSSSSSSVFAPVFESSISYSLVTIDFFGHGESPSNGKYSVSDMKDQILSVIENIDDDILLVGNSLGGHLAIEVAKAIEKLKGLLIFASPPLKKPINAEEAFIAIPEMSTFLTENPSEESIDKALSIAVQNKDVIPLLKEDFLKCDPKVRSVIATEFEEYADELEILTNLSCHKFIIKGEQDPSVNPIYLEQNKTKANYELISLANCGHYPSIEKPKEFIDHLEKIALLSFNDKK